MKILFYLFCTFYLFSFSSGKKADFNPIYTSNRAEHPLTPFYLSYSEWETIDCIISNDKEAYLDKSMIALIEKSGKLRIHYLGEKIHLNPVKKVDYRFGKWSNTFKNEEITIEVSADFDSRKILRHMSGTGNIHIQTPNSQFDESAFFVTEFAKK